MVRIVDSWERPSPGV